MRSDVGVARMRTARVEVLPYREEWQTDFEKIKAEISEALGELAIDVLHVGSTSVVGLAAKPYIDIDVVIEDYSVFESVVERLSLLGYIHEGNLGIKGREAFKYIDKPHLATHHLYVCPRNSEELHRHLTFRDYLRRNPSAVRKYSEVKLEAARLYPNDIDGYIAYKSAFIEEAYRACGLIK